ncbi:MAG TPA: hypothetical protein VIH90_05875 [Candidatus Saccharimonadales bacterium]
MSDGDNTDNQVPRVVKGTGFYTPMDLVPGEAPSAGNAPQSPAVVGEMIGMPIPMNVSPTETTTKPPSAQPPQSGDSNNAQDS